jgi:hypothetical protein
MAVFVLIMRHSAPHFGRCVSTGKEPAFRHSSYTRNDKQIIERLSYPRFKGVVTFNSPLSDIEEIELLDETRDPSVIAKAMREAGDFLINYKPKGDE